MEARLRFSVKYDRVFKEVSLEEAVSQNAFEVCDYNWAQKEGSIEVGVPVTLADLIEQCPDLAYDAIRNKVPIEVTIKWERENETKDNS